MRHYARMWRANIITIILTDWTFDSTLQYYIDYDTCIATEVYLPTRSPIIE